MMLLVGSVLTLLAGPLIYAHAQQRPRFMQALDGFVFIAIGGLVFIEVLPEVTQAAGLVALIAVAAGLWGPTLLERGFARLAHETHMVTVLLSALGLVVHTVFDGAALTDTHRSGLGVAILIHRIPVGLAVWWLLRPVWGVLVPSLLLGVMAAGTILGYSAGLNWHVEDAGSAFALLQAFVAGSILHVVFNRPHLDPEHHAEFTKAGGAEGYGNLLGLAVLALVLSGELLDHGHVSPLLQRLLDLSLAAAPALVLAYLAGGLIAALMPASSVNWLRRGGHASQAMRGMIIGLPMPVCSCGVVPLYQSLIRRGAPPAAAMAFLIATPELGLDALLISVPLLGLDMTVARLVAAALVALLVGWWIGRLAQVSGEVSSCCNAHAPEFSGSRSHRAVAGVRYGLTDLVDSTAPWIVLGLIVAAVAQPLLQTPWLQAVPPLLQTVLFAALGMPLYVCATGSTPIVAVMLVAGVAPGAALAFLLTGPATNPATFGVLARLHGRRIALLFGLGVAGLAIAGGQILNLLEPARPLGTLTVPPAYDAFARPALVLMLILIGASLLRRGARQFVAEVNLVRVRN